MNGCRLYVGNLPFETASGAPLSTRELRDFFTECGEVLDAHIVLDGAMRSKGFGFVEFAQPEEAKAALAFDGFQFCGRTIKVAYAQPRTQHADNRASDRRSA